MSINLQQFNYFSSSDFLLKTPIFLISLFLEPFSFCEFIFLRKGVFLRINGFCSQVVTSYWSTLVQHFTTARAIYPFSKAMSSSSLHIFHFKPAPNFSTLECFPAVINSICAPQSLSQKGGISRGWGKWQVHLSLLIFYWAEVIKEHHFGRILSAQSREQTRWVAQ